MLRHRLRLSRETLRRAVQWLVDEDYVLRNPGYGHPLRPELLLTPWGEAISNPCQNLLDLQERDEHIADVIRKKWTLPVLVATHVSDGRYSQVAAIVEECSSRALSQALRCLEDSVLIKREIVEMRPVRIEYRLTKMGREFAEAGLELAKEAQ